MKARLRATLSWLHLWVGLVVGTLFALVGLSGSVLVFHDELLRMQHPQLEGHAPVADGEVLAGILARCFSSGRSPVTRCWSSRTSTSTCSAGRPATRYWASSAGSASGCC